MAQGLHPRDRTNKAVPYWSQVLRSLREARGITQEGWAAQLGYSRATVRRWESGQTVPTAHAERAIIALCGQKRLFREFREGPLLGVNVTSDWISDQLAMARLQVEEPPYAQRDPGPSFDVPPVSYASNGDVSLAYQAFGDGPVTFVITPGTISHREMEWENPAIRGFLLHLADNGRVVIYDKRATGLSDRVAQGTSEDRINDLRAVMDAAECEQVVLVGFTEGGPISIKFAATWPERVEALVLYGTSAQLPNVSPETDAESFERIQRVWGTSDSGFLEKFAPTAGFDQREREWWARFQRLGASPGAIRDLNAMNASLNVSTLLERINVPTLVIHRAGDLVTPFEDAVHIAQTVPDARLVTLEGDNHMAWAGDSRVISGAMIDFVSNLGFHPKVDHVLTTMVSFHIRKGNQQVLQDQLARLRMMTSAREVQSSGGGLMMLFDSPTSAIRCVTELQQTTSGDGLAAGVGIHTAEITREGQSITGDAVRICHAMAAAAPAGCMLVSETVTQLAENAAFKFSPYRLGQTNGIPEDLELFTLRSVSFGSVQARKSGEAFSTSPLCVFQR